MKKTRRKRKKPSGGDAFAVISCKLGTRKRWLRIAKSDGRSPDEVLRRVAVRIEDVGLDAVLGL